MIRGIAASLNTTKRSTARKRNRNLTLLSDQLKFLNFKANRSILDTNSREKATQIQANTTGLRTKSKKGASKSGNAVIKRAFAGVGNPLKESDCVSSRLKIAKRNADATAISKAVKGKKADDD